MSKFITAQTSFRAGKMSKKMFGRVDIREYAEALSEGINGFVAKQGGFYKRFGTQTIMALPDSDPTRVKFSVTLFENSTYHLLFEEDYLYILDSGGHRLVQSFPFSFTYGGNVDPSQWSVAIYENYIFATHYSGTYTPIVINFINETSAFIDIIPSTSFWGLPFDDPNTDSNLRLRIKNVNNINALQIEANYAKFTSDMVGEFIRIVGLTNYPTPNGVTSKVLQSDIFRIDSYVSPTLVNVTATQGITLKSQPLGGGTIDDYDYCVFANFDSAITLTSTDSAYYDEWQESSWSTRKGWPRTVCVDEGRLIFGGTPAKPATFYGSQIGNPLFFLDKRFVTSTNVTSFHGYTGDILDSDPYQFTIASKLSSKITFMESSVSFIIGTERQEFIISGNGQTISKKNVSVRPHTSHGSAPLLSVSSDNVVFYVGKTREQLFLFKYNEANGSYISQEISMLNDDVFKKKIKRLVWHEELGLLMVLLDTAELVTITFNNESGTLALTEHEFSFPIKDISYGIGGSEDDYAVLLTQKDGRDFIEVLDRRDLGFISSTLQAEDIHKKIPHGDSVQTLEAFGTEFPTFISATQDIMEVDASKYVVGQEVVFTSSDPNILLGTGLSLSTLYYAIPVASGGVSGIRLATSPANAAANTYIDITGFDQYFTVTPLRMDTNRLPLTTIPVLSYAEGDQIQIFHDNGGVVNSVTYTKVSGETEFDLGVTPDASVVSAVAFKMTMATMPVEAGQQWGTAQLALKRIDNLLVRFYESYSFKFSTDGYNEEEVVYNEITTGRVERALTASSEYDQRVFITNDKIEPCYISNLSMRGVSNDG